MSEFGITASQTVGPFLKIGLAQGDQEYVVAENAKGALRIDGHVYDGQGQPVPDAMIEIWQCDTQGRLPTDHHATNTNFTGFARAGTDENGRYVFETVKPGRISTSDNILQAPHIDVLVFARGLLSHLYTRIYFSDESSKKLGTILNSLSI